MEHEERNQISDFLNDRIYPKSVSTGFAKRNFRRKCKPFFVDSNDILWYKSKNGNCQRVLKKDEVTKVLASIHSQNHGGHLGVNKTWKKSRETYYWKGSFQQVQNFVAKCDHCQKKGGLKKAQKPLCPVPVPDTAFSQIGMDMVGPLEETERGNKYILVFTDYLTKWVEAEGVPNKSADTVLKCFVQFISRHGVPDKLITDQGREFCNDLNERFCKAFGVNHRVPSPYHPQTGGHTERFNKTLCHMLKTTVNSAQNDWDDQLPYVLFAYRTAEHASTKSDPFSLVYGRKARLPVELDIPSHQDQSGESSLLQRSEAFLKLSLSLKDAKKNITKAQKKQKRLHDANIQDTSFKLGDKVLLHNSRRVTRKGGKLEETWTGPYKIRAVLKSGAYKLTKAGVNGNRLKTYISSEKMEQPPPSTDDEQQADTAVTSSPAPLPNKIGDDYEDVPVVQTEGLDKNTPFYPVDDIWQGDRSSSFKTSVKKSLPRTKLCQIMDRSCKPNKTVPMRGDGNCLFRSFSYLLFGVESLHKIVRAEILNFMAAHEELMTKVDPRPTSVYIEETDMSSLGTWGSDVEISAFATMMNTTIYVYTQYYTNDGTNNSAWLKYSPLNKEQPVPEKSIYLSNVCAHFVPVVGVEVKPSEQFTHQPYLGVKHYLPQKYINLVSGEILNSIIVDNHKDEAKMRRLESSANIFVYKYTDVPFNIPGTESVLADMDATVFNLLCDWDDLPEKLPKRPRYC